MSSQRPKVVVAMSGGVDSSVAACLLQERGYDVVGLFMRVAAAVHGPDRPGGRAQVRITASRRGIKGAGADADLRPATPRTHQGCCSAGDAADARYVAGKFGVPFYALNFASAFDEIIDYFADEYVRGRTPNPCVVCNDKLKFGKLVDYADAVGARYIATGHYARIEERNGRRLLCRGVDETKDQSYVLFGLRREILDRVLFPVGDLTKDEVRRIAARHDLPNADKPDSVEICFVPDRDYAAVVHRRRPEAFREGEVVDTDGEILGTHKGLGHYTVGQRRGLGIAVGHPVYVTQLNVERNRVTVGGADDLLSSALIAGGANFLVGELPTVFNATVKIRYLHQAAPATVKRLADARVRIAFKSPQRAVTPGQAVVIYDGDVVLGGAWIDHAEPLK